MFPFHGGESPFPICTIFGQGMTEHGRRSVGREKSGCAGRNWKHNSRAAEHTNHEAAANLPRPPRLRISGPPWRLPNFPQPPDAAKSKEEQVILR